MWYILIMNKNVIYIEPEDDITDVITKIENSKERARLKSIVSLLKPVGVGVIIRTEAEGQSAPWRVRRTHLRRGGVRAVAQEWLDNLPERRHSAQPPWPIDASTRRVELPEQRPIQVLSIRGRENCVHAYGQQDDKQPLAGYGSSRTGNPRARRCTYR